MMIPFPGGRSQTFTMKQNTLRSLPAASPWLLLDNQPEMRGEERKDESYTNIPLQDNVTKCTVMKLP